MTEETKPQVVSQKLEIGTEHSFSRPKNFIEALEIANAMAKSDIVPNEYKGKPANILVASLYGDSVGLGMMQSLQSICVINGKPSMYGDVGLAIIQNSDTVEYIEESLDEKAMKATCKVKRKNDPVEVTRSYTLEDAKKAGLLGKENWIKYPKRMLQMRARWWALRDKWPDKLKGLQGREEVEDYTETTAVEAEPLPLRKSEMSVNLGPTGVEVKMELAVPIITQEERKELAELAADRGITTEVMKTWLKKYAGVESSKDLPKDKLETMKDLCVNGEPAPDVS